MPSRDLAVPEHDPEDGRRGQHERQIAPQLACGNQQRGDERRQAEDQQDIGDVGAHDVAYGDARAARQRCLHRDEHFRG